MECRAEASVKDTFLWEVKSCLPFLFFKLLNEVGNGSPCPPRGSQVSVRAVPLTYLVIAGGLGGDQATALLSSRHNWL